MLKPYKGQETYEMSVFELDILEIYTFHAYISLTLHSQSQNIQVLTVLMIHSFDR